MSVRSTAGVHQQRVGRLLQLDGAGSAESQRAGCCRQPLRAPGHTRCGDRVAERRTQVVVPDNVSTILVSNNAYSPGVAPGPALSRWRGCLGASARLNDRKGPLFWRWREPWSRCCRDAPGGGVADAGAGRRFTGPVPRRSRGEAVDLTTPLQFSSRPGACASPAPSRRGRWASRWLSPVDDWVRGHARWRSSVDHREASDRFARSTGAPSISEKRQAEDFVICLP